MADLEKLGNEQNPLRKYFRQPKVYLNLPSRGIFYPPGAIDLPENGELPIYAMTAKDELTMKTPDALLNGQATVDLVKSCVPNIKDPWLMPSVDLDAVLIAIRIATYGDTMELTTTTPVTGVEKDFSVDLNSLLADISGHQFETEINIEEFHVRLRPLTYREFTDVSLKTFEEQRVFALVNDDTMSEQEKLEKFNVSFKKLTEINITTLSKSISSIEIGDDKVTSQKHIDEFIANCDKNFFKEVTDHLEKQKDKFNIKPLTITATEEEQAAGVPEKYEVPITFDQSNFFV